VAEEEHWHMGRDAQVVVTDTVHKGLAEDVRGAKILEEVDGWLM
jgi:hypothetical protein